MEQIIKSVKHKDFYEFSKKFEENLKNKVSAFIPNMVKGVIEDALKLNKKYEEQ